MIYWSQTVTKFHCKKCNTRFSTEQAIEKCPICCPVAATMESQAVQQAKEAVTKFAHEQIKLATSGLGKSNAVLSIVFGVLLFVPIYVLLLLSPENYAREIITQRGIIPIVLGVLSLSTLISILFKWVVSRREKPTMNNSWLGLELNHSIGPNNVALLLQRIANDTRNASRTQKLVVARVLQRYAHCPSAEKTEAYAGEVLDECYTTVVRSYSTINLIIWALPLLGFIGTVLGIGNSVGGFSGAISGSGDMEVIKQSLSTVTSGLALSFDTTLLALVLSILLTFPKSHVKHAEESVLEGVERFLRERLLPRLEDIRTCEPRENADGDDSLGLLLQSQHHFMQKQEQLMQGQERIMQNQEQLLQQLVELAELLTARSIQHDVVVPIARPVSDQTLEDLPNTPFLDEPIVSGTEVARQPTGTIRFATGVPQ